MSSADGYSRGMLILGVLLLLFGLFFGVPLLTMIGLVLAVLGALLLVASTRGRGPRVW